VILGIKATAGYLVSLFNGVPLLRRPQSRRPQQPNQNKRMEEKQLDDGIGDTLVSVEADE